MTRFLNEKIIIGKDKNLNDDTVLTEACENFVGFFLEEKTQSNFVTWVSGHDTQLS